jgi:type III pantothenate kinase
MVSLCFDIGNTLTKLAVFRNNEIIHFCTKNTEDLPTVNQIIEEYRVDAAIVSSVSKVPELLTNMLQNRITKLLMLTDKTRLPIENCYETKETLGKDRLAAVVGANYMFPGNDLLVIDAGTAITYDLINRNSQYLGGNISPGIQMRFKALNHFTSRLPLLEATRESYDYGKNTTEAICAGVQNGIVFEADGTINHFKEQYPGINVLLTGGDAKFFENRLKNVIFVVSNLVMIGLNRILAYNAQNL